MVSTATLLLNSEKVINDVSNTLIRVEQTASIGCMPSPRGVLQRIGLEPPSMGLHSPRISARWAASAAAQRQRQLQMQRVHSPVASTMPSNNRELLDETNSGGVMNEADGIKSKVSTSSSQNCTTLPQLPQNAISSSNNIPGMIPMPLSMQMPNAPTMGAPISMPVMTAQGTQLSLPFHMPMPPSMTTASMSLPTPATEAPPLSLMDSIQDAPSTFEASKNNDDSTVLQAGLMSPPLGAPIEHDPYFMEDVLNGGLALTASSRNMETRVLLAPATLAVAFVGSIYLTKLGRSVNRDHPAVIRRRLLGCTCVALLSPIVLFLVAGEYDPLRAFGLTKDTWQQQPLWLPTCLVFALFLGPLTEFLLSLTVPTTPMTLSAASLSGKLRHEVDFWDLLRWKFRQQAHDLRQTPWITARNYLLGPLLEEVVFRPPAALILAHTGSLATALLVPPFLFGLAHTHHALMLLRHGYSVLQVMVAALMQVAYTTAFGVFASYVYLCTGSLAGAVLAHGVCNYFGVPAMSFLQTTSPLRHLRRHIWTAFGAGIALFALGVALLLRPARFQRTSLISQPLV
ncbi:MAG: hypothetical protein MHM6MM_000258 [Cercozoa sp. M6MM]